MENIDDILAKNKEKKEPYKIPEGYFDDFEARLNARIDAMEAQKEPKGKSVEMKPEESSDRKHKIWLTIKPLLYVAACITVLYAATYVIVQPKINESRLQEARLDQQDSIRKLNQEYEDFYQYFVEDIDEDDDNMIDLLTSNN